MSTSRLYAGSLLLIMVGCGTDAPESPPVDPLTTTDGGTGDVGTAGFDATRPPLWDARPDGFIRDVGSDSPVDGTVSDVQEASPGDADAGRSDGSSADVASDLGQADTSAADSANDAAVDAPASVDTSVDTADSANVVEAASETSTPDAQSDGATADASSDSATQSSDLIPKSGCVASCTSGPCTTRIMLATSADGLSFTRTNEVVADQVGVPMVMLDLASTPRIYYVDWGNGNVLATAISSTSGWMYRKVTIQNLPSGSDPVDPTVRIVNGRYRLFFMQTRQGDIPKFYSAVSDDGLSFTLEDGTRYSPGREIYDPMVLSLGSIWQLWGQDSGNGYSYQASSTDGLNFSKLTDWFQVGGQLFVVWAAEPYSGGYRIFGNFANTPDIVSARSTDQGVSWVKDDGVRLSATGGDPSLETKAAPDHGVARLSDGTWLMGYLGEMPRNNCQ